MCIALIVTTSSSSKNIDFQTFKRHLPDPKALAMSHVKLHDILALVKS